MTVAPDGVTAVSVLAAGSGTALPAHSVGPDVVAAGRGRLVVVDAVAGSRADVLVDGVAARRGVPSGGVVVVPVAAGPRRVQLVRAGTHVALGPARGVQVGSGRQVLVTVGGLPGSGRVTVDGLGAFGALPVQGGAGAGGQPTVSCASGQVRLDGSNLEVLVRGDCPRVQVNGGAVRLHVTGRVDTLQVNGGRDVVTVDGAVEDLQLTGAGDGVTVGGAVRSLQASGVDATAVVQSLQLVGFSGQRCTVTYHSGPAPQVSDTGASNTARQR